MLRYDLTNWIFVTGDSLEEMRENWEHRRQEQKNNKPNVRNDNTPNNQATEHPRGAVPVPGDQEH